MSYKQKIASAIATGFAVVSFSAFASAQTDQTNQQPQDSTQRQEKRERKGVGKHGESGGKHHGDKMGMRELAQLNLSDAQKQQIRTIMEANRGEGKNSANFQEMRQLMQAKRDGTITVEQEQTLKNFKHQMRQNAKATNEQVLAILTTEQRAQLAQIKEQRREQMKQRREMRRNASPNDVKKVGDTQKDS